MMIIRPIRESDTKAYTEFVFEMTLGMRSLPKNKDRLIQKIKHSVQSFGKTSNVPDQELYLFVLEDSSNNQIAGTCAIWTKKGVNCTDHFYRIDTIPSCELKELSKETKVLKVVSPKEDINEIGSLYLRPDYQHHGLGLLLSLSRFLFAAGHLNRLYPSVLAEMRGIITNQTCPFWEGIGRHFCDIPFSELMQRLDNDRSITPKILPTNPIYISLLTPEVQQTIGTIHESTTAALKMLLREGFEITNDIDLFDGGPIIKADLRSLHTVKESKVVTLGDVVDENNEGEDAILSNDRLDFRACYGKVKIGSDGKATLKKDTTNALNLKPGDTFRYI